ncbi:MAG TPA: hypothetical protein VHS53_13865 [Mucilaginibacter sp.]|jgi:hypothetical protein|nr:hypothetical protein [Mucilaginibacter sp.]
MIKPLLTFLLLVNCSAFAQTHADSTAKHKSTDTASKHKAKVAQKTAATPQLQHSTIRGLSDEKYTALLKGEGFDDMALVGELNHYPMPDKALKYKGPLQLNPGQITQLKDIVANLQRKKKEMGENFIRNEKMLDTLFHTRQIDNGTLIFYTNRYGLYTGEVRNAVLQACLKTEAILSDVQIKKLESLLKTN